MIIGGGLAGSEAAWQSAQRGVQVSLFEMRPVRGTPAHVGDQLELFARKALRPVWRSRAEIEAHLESRTRLGR